MLLVKKPVLCNYYLTYRCNAACSFCDIWEKPSPYATRENVEANLRDLKKLGVKIIDFTGGEPLLHKELPDFLAIARRMGFITTVTTNTLLYPKHAEKLKGLIDMLHFSLDAADEETHNASRGVACFGHFMKSLDVAAELGERPDILFTVTAENMEDIEKIYTSISRPRKLMLILNPVFSYNDVGSSLSHADLNVVEAWGKKPGVYLNQAFINLRRDGGNHTSDPVCKAATTSLVISPQNELVLPCYHLGIKHIPIENNLYALRQSPEVQAAMALEGRHDACEGCTINCYMQPSFAVNLNRYWMQAAPSTLKYSWHKGTWKRAIGF